MRTLLLILPAAIAVSLGAAGAASQERQGRYVMSPAENGFFRLDTETGATSFCGRRDDRLVCEPIEDEAKALREEVERLRAEVQRLQEQAALGGRPGDRRERKLELPTEEEVDKALDYVESIFRKFRDRIRQFEQEERKDRSQPGEGKDTQL